MNADGHVDMIRVHQSLIGQKPRVQVLGIGPVPLVRLDARKSDRNSVWGQQGVRAAEGERGHSQIRIRF